MNEQTRKGRIHTVTDAVGVGVGEDGVLAEVGKTASLLNEGWGQTMSIGDIVNELSVHEVPELESTVSVFRRLIAKPSLRCTGKRNCVSFETNKKGYDELTAFSIVVALPKT